MMGYSDSGEVVDAGAGVSEYGPGQRVGVSAPHAQYVLGSPGGHGGRVVPLAADMGYEAATFLPLAAGGVAWSRATPIKPGDTVVVQGQGLVGNLYSQAVRERRPDRVITTDAYELRCDISRRCGADEVINVSVHDSVEAVMDLTGGNGADVVVECVGGDAGVKSFEQTMRMVKRDGVVHLIALYQGKPLLLDSSLMMNKQIVGGYWNSPGGPSAKDMEDTARMLIDGRIQFEPLITHRFPWRQTPDAYHFLYRSPDEALGVILEWDD
jgi:L-iditol 2-dehydrogenase